MSRVTFGPFSIEPPPEWTLSSVILAGPVTETGAGSGRIQRSSRPFQKNLIATMEQVDEAETAESYIERQLDGLRRARINQTEIGEAEPVSLAGGLEGVLTERVILTDTGERVRQMQLVTIKNSVAFTLITSHLDGEPFDMAKDEFRSFLLSFR